MAYDKQIERRKGSILPLYAQLSASSGTLTIAAGGTFTLYDSTGTVLSSAPLTGFDAGPLSSPRAWYVMGTAALSAPAVYLGQLQFQATSSVDGIQRTYVEDVEISLVAAAEMVAATYNPATSLGQVRFFAADTNIASAIWSDAELNQLLLLQPNPMLAAALALIAGAADASKLAIISKNDSTSTDMSKLSAAMLASAAALEDRAGFGIVVVSPKPVFVNDDDAAGDGSIQGGYFSDSTSNMGKW